VVNSSTDGALMELVVGRTDGVVDSTDRVMEWWAAQMEW
jgi:hypothetical protein